ncbi:hypothetical protein ACVGOW_01005 [Pseudonocardia saturnea]
MGTGTDGGPRCVATVSGHAARTVGSALRSRFDVASTQAADHTVLTVSAADQAPVRALLVMLWDSGHEVLAMSTGPS